MKMHRNDRDGLKRFSSLFRIGQQGFCERQDPVRHGESSSLSQWTGEEGAEGWNSSGKYLNAPADIWDVSKRNSYILSIESILDEKFYCFEVRLSCFTLLFIFCSLPFLFFSFLFFRLLFKWSIPFLLFPWHLQGERSGLTTYVWILLNNISLEGNWLGRRSNLKEVSRRCLRVFVLHLQTACKKKLYNFYNQVEDLELFEGYYVKDSSFSSSSSSSSFLKQVCNFYSKKIIMTVKYPN